MIYSFTQSKLWQNKVKHFPNRTILPLFLYYDDFEVNNPLGSHAGVQKLGAVYVSLACLPPELSSTLDNIILTSLFKTDTKKSFGNLAVFKNLIDELNYLETVGIGITVNNKEHTIFFMVGLIIGDNLGMHSILGLTESFVATYPCRFCKSTRSQCQVQITQNDNSLRNSDNYEAVVKVDDVSFNGIKELCVWNTINSFNITTNFSVDIMHDMLEGVCKFDLGMLLKKMINEFKYFSIDTLNNRIQTFDYGPIDIRNRPTLLSNELLKQGTLKMSSCEMLCFTRNLGLIIGDLVPIGSELWSLYIILNKILDILLSKWIRTEEAVLLKTLVAEHHELFLKLFQINLRPKHHHMVHYSMIIQESGPLSLFWCMRFEAKHKELKDTANAITSRKNMQYTLLLKQQLKLAY